MHRIWYTLHISFGKFEAILEFTVEITYYDNTMYNTLHGVHYTNYLSYIGRYIKFKLSISVNLKSSYIFIKYAIPIRNLGFL